MNSRVLTAVVHDLTTRETRGIDKYGTTLDRNDLSPTQRLQHFYEEMLDGAMYAKSLLLQLEEQGIELHDPRALAARWREAGGLDAAIGGEVQFLADVPPDDKDFTYEKKPVLVSDAPHNWIPITAEEAKELQGLVSMWVVRRRGPAAP